MEDRLCQLVLGGAVLPGEVETEGQLVGLAERAGVSAPSSNPSLGPWSSATPSARASSTAAESRTALSSP